MTKNSQLDAVLLDDDPLVIEIWRMTAQDKNINLQTYSTSKELVAALSSIPLDTPFYIDSNLSDGEKGEDIAKLIFNQGYRNISLATGSPKEDFSHLDYLVAVIGKEPPFYTQND